MKKSLLLIAIMFLMFFINQLFVKAADTSFTTLPLTTCFNNGNSECSSVNSYNNSALGTLYGKVPNNNYTNQQFYYNDSRIDVSHLYDISGIVMSNTNTISDISVPLITMNGSACYVFSNNLYNLTEYGGYELNGRYFQYYCPNVSFIGTNGTMRITHPNSSINGWLINSFKFVDITLASSASSSGVINAQNQTTNAVNNVNNSINNSNTSGAQSDADGIKNNSNFQDSTGLSGIVSMPLTFVNNLGNSCQPISLTIPYMNYTFTLPCMQSVVNNYMPGLVVVLKVVVNGLLIYWVLLDIFRIVKNAKNPDDDRIEVLDL